MTDNYADYTTPGMDFEDSHRIADILQVRLHALNDLHLTLKHAHWNVVDQTSSRYTRCSTHR